MQKSAGTLAVLLVAATLLPTACTRSVGEAQNDPLPAPSSKSRVLVLTDIENEPDDAQSLVRFLLYTNEMDVKGLRCHAITPASYSRKYRKGGLTNPDPTLRRDCIELYKAAIPAVHEVAASAPDMQFAIECKFKEPRSGSYSICFWGKSHK